MAAYSVALSAWAFAAATNVDLAPPDPSSLVAGHALPSPDGVPAPGEPRVEAGFLMEGAPEVEAVFGDTPRFRGHIDRFFALHERMRQSRAEFSRSIQTALAGLSAARGCPAARLAPLYRRAHVAGDRFRRDGVELENEYVVIRTLEDLGEREGLTPDYRWKVDRIRSIYRDALIDYREIRVAFVDQLGAELRARGCNLDQLLALGAKAPPPVAADPPAPSPPPGRRPPRKDPDPIVPAQTVTFFIDNQRCATPVDVYVEGTLLGEAAAGTRAAFQALEGRHMLCLLEPGAGAECGAPGTVRTAFVFDGWTVTMHCP